MSHYLPSNYRGDDSTSHDDPPVDPTIHIGTTPRRFVIIALFSLFGFINQIQYVAYAFVVDEAKAYFDIPSFQVNMLSATVPIIYVCGVLPGCYLYNKIGLRYGLILGTGLNASASILKMIALWSPHYALLIIAQILVAGGQIMFLSLPTFVASIWFPSNERALATAGATLMAYAGMAVGMFYSPRVVSLPDHNERKNWVTLFGPQFGVSIVLFVLVILFVHNQPKLKPSITATDDHRFPDMLNKVKHQFSQRNLVLLYVSFGGEAGMMTAVCSVLTQILQPFGISNLTAGALGFGGILFGAVNCAIAGRYLDVTHRFRVTLIILVAIVLLLVTIIFLFAVSANDDTFKIAAYILVPLICCLLLPTIPTAMEFSVEMTYPEPAIVSTTLALGCMSLFSLVGTVVFTIVLGNNPVKNRSFIVLGIVLGVLVLSLVGVLFVKEELKRAEMEEMFHEEEGDCVNNMQNGRTP